jgi:4-amino-4-deoxy-L-arabinose transferase-like glycosyltransferase
MARSHTIDGVRTLGASGGWGGSGTRFGCSPVIRAEEAFMKETARRKGLSRHAIIFAVIMVAAIVIRIVWLAQLAGSDLGSELSVDSQFYRSLANDIASGKSLPAGALTFNPLYPFFLAAVFRLFGAGFLATRIVQALLGLVTVALVYLAGKRIVEGPRKGKLSGIAVSSVAMALAVLYPQFILYEGMFLGTTLEVFLLIVSFTLALEMDEDMHGERVMQIVSKRVPPWLGGGILGLVCGAGSLGRPNLFLLLTAGIPVWMIARNWRKRIWIAPVLGFAVGAGLLLMPPTIHNARSTGEFVPVTTHGGINFYIGNRPGTSGVYQPPEGMRGDMRGVIEDSRSEAERETGHAMTNAETSDYFMKKALQSIEGDPAAWLLLLGRKFVLMWNKIEVHDMPEVLYFQDSLPLFKFPFIPFSVIAPLGIAGFIILLRSGRNRSIVCLFLGSAHLSILLFYINTRYRLPIVPVVIILAALFVAWVAKEISRRRMKYAAFMIGLAVVVFFVVSDRTIVEANRGSVYVLLGTHYLKAGNEAKAAAAFAEAYRLDPNRDTSIINYARILMTENQLERASQLYARAYDINPRYPGLAIEYAYTLERLGRHEEARKLALEVYSSGEPAERVTACKILATAAFFGGKKAEAIRWAQAGLQIAPQDQELDQMLKTAQEMP